MLNTPFGTIKITADGIMLEYEAIPFCCQVRSVVSKPLAGCYRITVPNENYRMIRCELEWNCSPIENTGSSGERYLCSEFVKDAVVLTIGAGDEMLDFETVRLDNGIEYICSPSVDKVMFGVSWTTDHEGQFDIRTQLATDLY
ncbi:MAG: hypothetical protein E7477_01940 [Ruminococcaceae bacterium]|nr:hypothetical protein [Oscillospiraceae bacterium]